MAEKKAWDLTSTRGLESAAEWIRLRSGGIVVVVVRGQDFAFAVDEACAPSDAADVVRELLPEMIEQTNAERVKKREAQVRKRAAEIAGHSCLTDH